MSVQSALQLDHVVIAAATLADGVAWCEQRFGVTPSAGGQHAFMGTHNRLFSVASARFPRAYAEIIAIDPAGRAPASPRWFDLDDPQLQRALQHGPQLIHWVARTNDIDASNAAWRGCGIDPGQVRSAERDTPSGRLRWQICLRADGARLFDGALPTLIQWGEAHPCDLLPDTGVRLDGLLLAGLPGPLLAACIDVPGVRPSVQPSVRSSALDPRAHAPIRATLTGPLGEVTLDSWHMAD